MSTYFPKLIITSVQYLADSFNRPCSLIVPSRVYGLGEDRVQTVEDALEVVFRQLNAVDGNELISEPEFSRDHPQLRSMSVGDSVTFRGLNGWRRDYVCEGCGWAEISRDQVDWLAENITSRDFWSTFAQTVQNHIT